ncbi:apolipoprotein N-acyltransferase [Aquimarina sp. EL_43]|uniref:nitrilase-related carbon-nitrogen hydrolase n=1 Tax=unclassified Aquimarina TaxID=2627091 RepID=UPI0018C9A2A4|nr:MULTISPECIES: nitrilase-related carbon-nitrogen hydrolase [unclassified Aquimarina]MBG6129224.1 apolipoprotein N-acyltransferase [Aquimarina sp. EL_35]MBG6150289.1 apolipoprotein N-acyltransferase [Aquimarina sp. EL_32]MBG6167025.1 apolipoprotein N-acyltransferase [Aquimarina sp. EL_43]
MKTVNNTLGKLTFLVILLLVLLISNGGYTMFFAPWISITMLLYAVRQLSVIKGFLLACVLLVIATLFQNSEILPFPFLMYALIMAPYGLIAAIPYLIDLLFSKNRNTFLHTLIFPTALVLIEYVSSLFLPYGSWGHIAYTQQSQNVLLQSVSVFGMGYITFLIGWFASIINWILIRELQWVKVKKGILIYSVTIGLTLGYGSYRLLFQKSNAETIRIASISAIDNLRIYDNDFYGLNLEGGKEKFKKQALDLNQNLLDRSLKEAKAGAKIVFWAEGNALVLKEDENKLYESASLMAKENEIYLGAAVAVIDPTNDKPLENKFVLFDPNGKKTIDYWKVIPVPGGEAAMSNIKGSTIQTSKTPYGIIGSAICFDMDFPEYLKQAKGTDIMLVPSNDWKGIDPIHTNMAKFRAIEQGFNLVRQTSFGLSASFNYTGKTLSEMDHFTDNSKILITQLPTKGTTTVYSLVGDIFIYYCLLMFIVVVIRLKKLPTAKRKEKS